MNWVINKADVHGPLTVVGSGRFGKVRTQLWRGTKVAIKSLAQTDVDENTFDVEFRIMTLLHHPNIVQTLGVMYSPLEIVMEYVQGQNLEELLEQHRFYTSISTSTKVHITRQLLQAITYLHNRQPEYLIHRDIKPTNVLIQLPGYTVKLADFGVSKLVTCRLKSLTTKTQNTDISGSHSSDPNNENWTAFVGSLRYMAPEVYNSRGDITKYTYTNKVDIWSFAMVSYYLWETKKPSIPVDSSCSVQQYCDTLLSGVRPQLWKTPKVIRNIITQAWHTDPEQRPEAIECLVQLEKATGVAAKNNRGIFQLLPSLQTYC